MSNSVTPSVQPEGCGPNWGQDSVEIKMSGLVGSGRSPFGYKSLVNLDKAFEAVTSVTFLNRIHTALRRQLALATWGRIPNPRQDEQCTCGVIPLRILSQNRP